MRQVAGSGRLGDVRAYRWQRFLLTRGVRPVLTFGLPAMLVLLLVSLWAMQAANRAFVADRINAAVTAFQQNPQFMVEDMRISGIDVSTMTHISDFLPKGFPVSSFDLELDVIKAQIEGLEQVKSASVRITGDRMLAIDLTPRTPVVVWRDGPHLRLVDADGILSGTVTSRIAHPELPLIGGAGAQDAISEALAIYANAGPLRARMIGLERMGQRRWDIVLDRDQRILLPSDGAVAALERIIVLDRAQDLLARDVAVVDMRNIDRPTLRMNPEAARILRRGETSPRYQEANN